MRVITIEDYHKNWLGSDDYRYWIHQSCEDLGYYDGEEVRPEHDPDVLTRLIRREMTWLKSKRTKAILVELDHRCHAVLCTEGWFEERKWEPSGYYMVAGFLPTCTPDVLAHPEVIKHIPVPFETWGQSPFWRLHDESLPIPTDKWGLVKIPESWDVYLTTVKKKARQTIRKLLKANSGLKFEGVSFDTAKEAYLGMRDVFKARWTYGESSKANAFSVYETGLLEYLPGMQYHLVLDGNDGDRVLGVNTSLTNILHNCLCDHAFIRDLDHPVMTDNKRYVGSWVVCKMIQLAITKQFEWYDPGYGEEAGAAYKRKFNNHHTTYPVFSIFPSWENVPLIYFLPVCVEGKFYLGDRTTTFAEKLLETRERFCDRVSPEVRSRLLFSNARSDSSIPTKTQTAYRHTYQNHFREIVDFVKTLYCTGKLDFETDFVIHLGCRDGQAVMELRACGIEAYGMDLPEWLAMGTPEFIREFALDGDWKMDPISAPVLLCWDLAEEKNMEIIKAVGQRVVSHLVTFYDDIDQLVAPLTDCGLVRGDGIWTVK